MTTVATTLLRTNWTAPEGTVNFGWYVSVIHEGRWKITSMKFGRQRDAEAALAALHAAGMTTAEDLIAAGRTKLLMTMAEAMQW